MFSGLEEDAAAEAAVLILFLLLLPRAVFEAELAAAWLAVRLRCEQLL